MLTQSDCHGAEKHFSDCWGSLSDFCRLIGETQKATHNDFRVEPEKRQRWTTSPGLISFVSTWDYFNYDFPPLPSLFRPRTFNRIWISHESLVRFFPSSLCFLSRSLRLSMRSDSFSVIIMRNFLWLPLFPLSSPLIVWETFLFDVISFNHEPIFSISLSLIFLPRNVNIDSCWAKIFRADV